MTTTATPRLLKPEGLRPGVPQASTQLPKQPIGSPPDKALPRSHLHDSILCLAGGCLRASGSNFINSRVLVTRAIAALSSVHLLVEIQTELITAGLGEVHSCVATAP
jgi:hypothetical protein